MANALTPLPDQSLLTPVLTIPTSVPAPNTSFASVNSDPGLLYGDGNRTITLQACSEFVTETVPLNPLDASHKLRVVQDASNQPILFTKGNDDKFYCAIRLEGSSRGWKVFDISPVNAQNGKIITFDALRLINGYIAIAVAFKGSDGSSNLNYASLPAFAAVWDDQQRRVLGFDSLLPWRNIPSSLGPKNVSSITISPTSADAALFQMVVGTEATSDRVGSHFVVQPFDPSGRLWREIKVPESARKIIDTVPANIWEGPGIYTLYERFDNTTGCTFDSLKDSFHYRMPLADIGNARSIYANSNPWNMTDLFVAGDNGIGFFNFAYPDLPPQLVLPGRAFSQVVSAEAVDVNNPHYQTKIVAFAVSQNNELYYLEGVRSFATNSVNFTASGFPIATDVSEVSTQYNATQNATEVMYLGSRVSEVWHLAMAAGTTAWKSDRLLVDGPSGITKIPAYLTKITFSTDVGNPVGAAYPVKLSSDGFVQATINGRFHVLGPTPSTIVTDESSAIQILVPVDDTLGGPHYTVTLTKFTSEPKSFQITAAQRVLRLLGNIKTSKDLSNATTTTGEPVFKNVKNDKLEDTSTLLSQFPAMLSTVHQSTAQAVLANPPDPTKATDLKFGYQRNDDGSISHSVWDWFTHAAEVAEHEIADFFSWLRSAIKSITKFAVQAVGKVIVFAFEILGKAVKFVARTIGMLIRGVTHFLKDYLGIDMTGFLNWLSFIFSVESTKKTQKMLLDVYQMTKTRTLSVAEEKVHEFESTMDKWTDTVKNYIPDNRVSAAESKDSFAKIMDNPIVKGLDWLFHNPLWTLIMKYNPLSILLESTAEAVQEEMSKFGIQSPAAFTKLEKVLSDFFTKEFDNIARMFLDIYNKISDIFSNPANVGFDVLAILGDIVWTMIDAVKTFVFALLEGLVAAIEGLFGVLEAEIHLGWVTDLFSDWAEQPFSMLNVTTYVVASILNIFTLTTTGKLPMEVFGDASAVVRGMVEKTAVKPNNVVAHRVNGRMPMANGSIHILATSSRSAEDIMEEYDLRSGWCSLASTVCSGFGAFVSCIDAWQQAGPSRGGGGGGAAGANNNLNVNAANFNAIADRKRGLSVNIMLFIRVLGDLGQLIAHSVNEWQLQTHIQELESLNSSDPKVIEALVRLRNSHGIQVAAMALTFVDVLARASVTLGEMFGNAPQNVVIGPNFPPNWADKIGKIGEFGDIPAILLCLMDIAEASYSIDKLGLSDIEKGAAGSAIGGSIGDIIASLFSLIIKFKGVHPVTEALMVCGTVIGTTAIIPDFGCQVAAAAKK